MLKVERIGLSPGRPGEAPAIEDVIDDGPKTMEDALKAIVARTGARRGDRAKLGPPDAESDIVGRRGPDTAWIPATSQGNRDDGERGCLEATVSALTSAISRTAAGSADKSEKPTKEMPRPPLQTIKGSATTESRESARSLLRFLGHSPLLHSEGVVWIKPAGERVHCIAALSSWSLFLVPLRDPRFGRGSSDGKGRRRASARIVEVPLSSILEVVMVSAEEDLGIFASIEDNRIAKPFRILTDTGKSEQREGAAVKSVKMTTSITRQGDRVLTFVGYEPISRLRYFLMIARESWAIRTSTSFDGPTAEMPSCGRTAARLYLAEVHEAMTGTLRRQADAHVDLMEDLADEMFLDTAVKEAFFCTGDIFFEIARHLQESAAASISANMTITQQGKDRNEHFVDRAYPEAVLDEARSLAAAAAVIDAAFFHSLQVPKRIDLIERAIPVSLPAMAEVLTTVHCSVHTRLQGCWQKKYRSDHEQCGLVDTPTRSLSRSSVVGPGRGGSRDDTQADEETALARKEGSMEQASKHTLDLVVRALNGISDAVRLFNIENESLGLVRNLVGVELGRAWRAGIEPAASEALGFLMAINDRVVGLIEVLHCEEQEQQQQLREAARGGLSSPTPTSRHDAARKKRGVLQKGSVLFNSVRSPGPRSERTITAPPTPRSPGSRAEDDVTATTTASVKARAMVSPAAIPKENDGEDKVAQGVIMHERSGRPLEKECSKEASKVAGTTLEESSTHRGDASVGFSAGRGRVRKREDRHPRGSPRCPVLSSPRQCIRSTPVILHSHAKLLNALVCGSYNLRAAYIWACEADFRNIGRKGGYLEILLGLDGGCPRMIFRETARFLREILLECHVS